MENNICTCVNCKLEIYEENDKCVLHCKKANTYDLNDLVYKKFYEELENLLKETDNVVLNYIIFPEYAEQDFNYQQMLKQLVSIHFNYCEFHTSHIDLENTKCFFQDCKFHTSWTLPNCVVLNDVADNVIYQTCTFYSNITNYTPEDNKQLAIYQASQFDYTCQFKQNINFYRAKFEEMLFNTNQSNYLDNNEISEIIFNKCIFEKKFKLNQYNIKKFSCKNSLFKNKFEFRENFFDFFEVINTNFEGICDCNLNNFLNFYMEKNVFNKYIGFEESTFGESTKEENQVAIFKYVSFLDYSYFRKAQFYGGLDLETTNLEEYPNFLDIYVEPNHTNKETFRIIKYSFDKIGNITEANKFFAYKMNKERQATKFNESPSKYLSLQLNYLISDFGQSFMRPLFLILYFLCLQFLVFCLMDSWKFDNGLIRDFWIGINHIIHDFMPLKKFLVEGKEFVSLFFLIIYSTLIYNLIIAVKRITKR